MYSSSYPPRLPSFAPIIRIDAMLQLVSAAYLFALFKGAVYNVFAFRAADVMNICEPEMQFFAISIKEILFFLFIFFIYSIACRVHRCAILLFFILSVIYI